MPSNGIIKKFTLSNSKIFTFSTKYNKVSLSELFIEARILYKTISDLPILPNLVSSIEKDLIVKSIFGTAAIEGNSLDEYEVDQILKTEKNEPKKRAEKEIINLKNSYLLLSELVKKEDNHLLEKEILDLHYKITYDIDYDGNLPGKYRSHKVKVGNIEHGGIYTPPYIKQDIKLLMKELVSWLNSKELLKLNPVIRAAAAHYHFALIHPFGDGNGRTARALEAYILSMAKIKYIPVMLSNYYYKNIDDYYFAFSNTRKSKDYDITIFLEFVLKGFVKSLYDIKDKITFIIRKFTLRDYYLFLEKQKSINKRQYELLNLLLDNNLSFELNELIAKSPFNLIFKNISERTIRRDIDNLLAGNYLIKDSKSKFKLNYNVLD